jgi:hypothetical protein
MATTVSTLNQRVRRFVGDWPQLDTLGASAASTATSLTVSENPASGLYTARKLIQIDDEVILVKSAASNAATLTVTRAVRGTTAASHANSATVLVHPHFLDLDVLDALNSALSASFPWIYRAVVDESLTTTADTYEYSVPDMPGITGYKIPYISEVWLKESGDTAYRRTRAFRILADETAPKLQFRRTQMAGATIRLVGFGPHSVLTGAGSLDALFPPHAEDALVWYAANYLLASGEASRVRADAGMVSDAREQANRVGSSMRAADQLFQRFQIRLRDAGMPPMPKHVISTF